MLLSRASSQQITSPQGGHVTGGLLVQVVEGGAHLMSVPEAEAEAEAEASGSTACCSQDPAATICPDQWK